MSKLAIGSRVTSSIYGLGTVIAELSTGCDENLHLIQFDTMEKGHDGFADNADRIVRGVLPKTGVRNCYYVFPNALTVVEQAPVKAQKTNRDRILAHLLAGKSITQLEAFGVYRIFRLAARIHELKQKGHKIKTALKMDETGKQYAEYSLVTARRA